MTKYIVRRLLGAIPVLIGVSIVVFAFIRLLPGDPATAVLGQHATAERIANMREALGLDKPLWEQYLIYVGTLLSGDLGRSVINGQPILDEFLRRFPATIELTLAAMIFAAGLGIPLGRYAAKHAQQWQDGVVTVISLIGISIPVFVLGLTLQYVFAVQMKQWAETFPILEFFVLPVSRRNDVRIGLQLDTNFVLIDPWLQEGWTFEQKWEAFADGIRHLILPAIALGSIPLAIITRITRASVIDVANEDYVRTARAKGIAERRIDSRHVMRNAWLPVVTVLGLTVGGLLAGAVITETVFSWPGVGSWVVEAIGNRDYFIVQSTILVFALIFLMVNLIVDVLYAFINPRIRYA